MAKLAVFIACCIVIVLSVLAIVAQMNANNTRAVEVQITDQGNWSGFYINQDSRIRLNGSGNSVLYLNRPSNATVWNIVVRIYELGPSNTNLTVRISTLDGQILDEDIASSVGTSALATFTVTPVFCIGDYYRCLSGS
jgi:hypothetical protein